MQNRNVGNKTEFLKRNCNRIVEDKNNTNNYQHLPGVNRSRTHHVKGKPIRLQTIVASVSGLVSEVMPHARTQKNKNERVNWMRIQECPIGIYGNVSKFVVILGLAKGYQIYLTCGNGEFEEVLSVRNVPLNIAHLLAFRVSQDRFLESRPIIALIYGVNLEECVLQSLRTGKILNRLKFETLILEIDSTSSYFVVTTTDLIILYSQSDLSEIIRIKKSSSYGSRTHFALSENLLAFSGEKLDQGLQSCGIVHSSSNSQILATTKTITKGVTSISGSIVSSLSGVPVKRSDSSLRLGIVSVLNTDISLKKSQIKGPDAYDFIAHFCAFSNSLVGHLHFGAGGQLLLVGSETSTLFKLIALHLHPNSPALCTLHHLYTLIRGNSIARVLSSKFSFDNRWIAISTNHGTTHLFAIAPYGGLVSARTHGGKFLNKEGKFERTTGIRSAHISAPPQSPSDFESPMSRMQPAFKNPTLLKTIISDRSFAFSGIPTRLNSIVSMKQKFWTDNLCAWAFDNTPVFLQAKKVDSADINGAQSRGASSKQALLFPRNTFRSDIGNMPVLLSLDMDGILTENLILPDQNRRHQINGESRKNDLYKKASITLEKFAVKIKPNMQWEFSRNDGTTDFELLDAPLSATNPLMEVCLAGQNRISTKKENSTTKRNAWLPFIEFNTYNAPHRRLWLGPQFTFSTYASELTGGMEATECNPDSTRNHIDATHCKRNCPVLLDRKRTSPSFSIGDAKVAEATTKIICGPWLFEPELRLRRIPSKPNTLKDIIGEAMEESSIKLRYNDNESLKRF